MGTARTVIIWSRGPESYLLSIDMSSRDHVNENTGLLTNFATYGCRNVQGCCQSMIFKCCNIKKCLPKLIILVYIYIYISVINMCVTCLTINGLGFCV